MKINRLIFVFLPVLLFVVSCKQKGCTDREADNYNMDAEKDDGSCIYTSKPGTIEFRFDNRVGEEEKAIVFNDSIYENTAGNRYSVSTLKYYISDFTLYRESGDSIMLDDYHYRDAQDTSTVAYLVEHIPAGNYTSFSFIFGLNEAKNVTGELDNNTENNNMAWPDPMGGGYHYMKFEGKYEDTTSSTQESSFNFHTGKLNSTHNYFRVDIEDNFDIEVNNNAYEVHLIMDINEWFANPYAIDLYDDWQAIMGNQDKQDTLKANGADAFYVDHYEAK